MDRPGLQSLLTEIKLGRIDVVVVYKVDRLTRSLADFAKLVELFDGHKVSFVSVTQSFNTTSSMGRLTLNVLLSFAQFEREVTGERIRDKIAASKKKGIWMGGNVPFGYRLQERKLLVEESEAKTIRLIFDLYLQFQSIPKIQRELRSLHIKSRVRTLATGKTVGGIDFTNGPIAHILRNRHYIGELNHKALSWPAEHHGIVERDVFDRVQAILTSQRQRKSQHVLSTGALLMGKIFAENGDRMSPTYTARRGIRFIYYVTRATVESQRIFKLANDRIPAKPMEDLVLSVLRAEVQNQIQNQDQDRDHDHDEMIPPLTDRDLVAQHLVKVIVKSNTVEILVREPEPVLTLDSYDEDMKQHAPRNEDTLLPKQDRLITAPWSKPSFKKLRDIIQPEEPVADLQPIAWREQGSLLKSIAIARQWMEELIEGGVRDTKTLALREKMSERSIRNRLSLAFLDPLIIKAAVEGSLPRGFGQTRLTNLPPDFRDQWKVLGLVRPI